MNPASPVQRPSPEQYEQFVVDQMVQRVKRDDIIRGLIRQGMSAPAAMQLVKQVEQSGAAQAISAPQPQAYARPAAAQRQPKGDPDEASRGRGMFLRGIIFLALGIGITVWGYTSASSDPDSGGTYRVFIGAIIYGLIDTIRGLSIWLPNI